MQEHKENGIRIEQMEETLTAHRDRVARTMVRSPVEGTVKKNTILFFNNFERMLNKHEMKPKVNENKLQEVESQEKKDNFKRKYVYLVVLFFLALSIYIANNE